MLQFYGDVFMKTPYQMDLDYSQPFVINFEHAHFEGEQPHALGKVVLKSKVRLEEVFSVLPLAASLANNHSFDAGEQGLNETIAYLEGIGVQPFGVGNAENNFRNPCILSVNGKTVSVIGYCTVKGDFFGETQSVARFSEEQFLKDVALSREAGAEVILPFIHWGVEESPAGTPEQLHIGQYMIDHGANAVIGTHPHCVQPIVTYKDRYIFYSIGNLVFDHLNEKSFYTNETDFICYYTKRQLWWNKNSLTVAYDEQSGDIHITRLQQQNGKLVRMPGTTEQILKQWSGVSLPRLRTVSRKLFSAFARCFFFEGKVFHAKTFGQLCKLFWDMHIVHKY